MKKIVKLGIGFGVGTIAVARVVGLSGANPTVTRNVNTAMEIGSTAVPIMSAKKVLKTAKGIL